MAKIHIEDKQLKTIVVKLTLLAVVTTMGAGCAKSVVVSDTFPEPLVDELPLTVGVVYNAKLTDYVHVEDPIMDAEWSIDIGQANLQMFRPLFKGMFKDVIELSFAEDGSIVIPDDVELDALLEPRLEDFEFSVPRQSGNDQYTVWIRYNIRITLPEGDRVGDWRITAYGQVDQGGMGLGDEKAMREAAVTALRDAAANIATSFSSAPGVKSKLLDSDRLLFQENVQQIPARKPEQINKQKQEPKIEKMG